jgi:hypothetical protein
LLHPRRSSAGGWGSTKERVRLLGLRYEPIDALDEFFSTGVWEVQDELLRMLRKKLLLRSARPSPQVTVDKKSESPKVFFSPRSPKITQDVFKVECRTCWISHAALQHSPATSTRTPREVPFEPGVALVKALLVTLVQRRQTGDDRAQSVVIG